VKTRLEELYPQPKRLTLGPHEDYYPDKEQHPDLCFGGGYYSCACGVLTPWKVYVDDGKVVNGIAGYFSRVCSTECYEAVTGTKSKWPKPKKPSKQRSPKPVEAAPVAEIPEHPPGKELPKPKLTKEMYLALLKKRLEKKFGK
jgi:hypothetical protein